MSSRHRSHRSRARDGWARERGSVTAEFAVAVPAVLIVVSLVLGAVAMQRDVALAATVAGQAARSLGRGESEARVRERIIEALPRASVLIDRPDGQHVCVSLDRTSSVGALFSARTQRQCARVDL